MLVKITKLIGGAAAATGLLALALTGAGTAHADTNPGAVQLPGHPGRPLDLDPDRQRRLHLHRPRQLGPGP